SSPSVRIGSSGDSGSGSAEHAPKTETQAKLIAIIPNVFFMGSILHARASGERGAREQGECQRDFAAIPHLSCCERASERSRRAAARALAASACERRRGTCERHPTCAGGARF